MIDAIVVGSGPGGVNAAMPLVAGGHRVRLLDYGNTDQRYASLIPRIPFSELRRTDAGQHRYFLGSRFEGIPFGPVRVGAQLTPPRMHILADAPERIPVEAPEFSVSMSLARGGLGAGWSAGVFPFVGEELADMGLGFEEMRPHYDAVAERIGVAGARDDLERFFPSSPTMLPALEIDTNAEVVFDRYQRQREALNAAGFFLGRTRLAVCTQRHRERGPHAYLDMAYWSDADRSVYRPQWTLDELSRLPGFEYVDRRLVLSFREQAEGVRVETVHAETGERERHEARVLVLAGGTLGTAWIVLRSLEQYGVRVPLLCNPYTYVPTLNLRMLGRPARDRRHSLAQLTAVLQPTNDPRHIVQAQVFSYRSLLTFKLMKEVPLPYRESLRALRLLIPSFAVVGIHHVDRPASGKFCVVERGREGRPDRLGISYRSEESEARSIREHERRLLRVFRGFGCWPLKTIRPGHGSSLHYAGTFPMLPQGSELTCDRDGRLRATQNVYVVDGSVFPWIPPKGLTFTLMANANRVGTLLAERLA